MGTLNFYRLILVILLVLVWGFNFVVIQIGLDGLPPIFLAFTRFFLTSLPAIFFFKRPKVPFYRIVFYGITIFALQFALFFIGMKMGVPPGLAAILMQVHVFFSLALAAFLFHEKIKPWQVAGAIIAFAGVSYAGTHVEGTLSLPGFFLIIGAAALWGIGSAVSKSLGKVNMVALVVWGSMVAWPILLLCSLLLEGPHVILSSLENLSWSSFGAVLYLTYLSTLFGFALWSWLLHHLPLSTVAPFTLMVPIIAMLSSVLVIGEPLQPWKIGAALLVIGGLAINFLGALVFAKKKKNSDSTLLQ